MSEDKRAFLLYNCFVDDMDDLTDDEAGKVIKAIFHYVAYGEAAPENWDRCLKAIYRRMKSTIDTNNEKWEKEKAKRQKKARDAANARWGNEITDC